MANEYRFLDEAGLLALSKEIFKNVKTNSSQNPQVNPSDFIVTEVNDSSDDQHVASAKKLNSLLKENKTYVDGIKTNLETLINQKVNKNEVYTKQETDDRIQKVINSAPEALDTLKELADALGNDANFAGTMATELAKKMDKNSGITKIYYETDKLRLKSTLDTIEFNVNKKVDKSDYDSNKTNTDAKISEHERKINTTTSQLDESLIALVDLQNKIKNKADKNGFDFARNFSLYGTDHPVLTKEIIDKTDYPQSYMGSINFGNQIGLPGNFVKILYIPHASDGYGTQIAICYDSGLYYGIQYRNGNQKQWRDWVEILDSRRANGHENYVGTTAPDNDANKCLTSGRPFYCHHNVTQHLPLGLADDGIIIPFIHRTDVLYGFQLFMSWNTYAIYWRVASNNSWGKWFCIGGGSWDQVIEKDSPQVMKYMRWENYGKNHIIFDASKSVRPDGQACDRTNSNQPWTAANCPTLMAFNGGQTWGVRVDSARTADQVQGRNLAQELDSLKQSAVDGKQTIINGINTAVGSNSGLTINSSWNDLSWWITNKTGGGISNSKCYTYRHGDINQNPSLGGPIFYSNIAFSGYYTNSNSDSNRGSIYRISVNNLHKMSKPEIMIFDRGLNGNNILYIKENMNKEKNISGGIVITDVQYAYFIGINKVYFTQTHIDLYIYFKDRTSQSDYTPQRENIIQTSIVVSFIGN